MISFSSKSLIALSVLTSNKISPPVANGFTVGIIGSGPASLGFLKGVADVFNNHGDMLDVESHKPSISIFSKDTSAAWSTDANEHLLCHQPERHFEDLFEGIGFKEFDEKSEKNLYDRTTRKHVGEFLTESEISLHEEMKNDLAINVEKINSLITNVTYDSESCKFQLDGLKSGNNPFSQEFDWLVVATGMTPPHIERQNLPQNFIDNPSNSIDNGKYTNLYDLLNDNIVEKLNKKRADALASGRNPDEEKVTISTLGLGGATELDCAYSLSLLPDKVKNQCEFLRIGNINNRRPCAIKPDSSLENIEIDFSDCKSYDELTFKALFVREYAKIKGYTDGNIRPLILEEFHKAVDELPESEKNLNNRNKYLDFYLESLSTEAQKSVEASDSLPNLTIINDRVDCIVPKENEDPYAKNDGSLAFTENEDKTISFKTAKGKEITVDFCVNCMGAVWKKNKDNLASIGINQNLKDSAEQLITLGSVNLYLEDKKNPVTLINIPAQLAPTMTSSKKEGQLFAKKILEEKSSSQHKENSL